ncbi:hypothetical protein [ANMV-1 virus]|nr:hypothetical protein [ANMV-1 virus]
MGGDLDVLDDDPFDEEEGEDLITEGMVKKATYLIHKLANRRGADYKEIRKKCKKLLGYENLAEVSMEQGHAIIDKLIELTGGEEEEKERPGVPQGPQLPTKPDDGRIKKDDLSPPADLETELERELGKLAEMLQICVHNSKTIFKNEFGDENITEGNRAMLVKSFAATIFIEAGKRGLGR